MNWSSLTAGIIFFLIGIGVGKYAFESEVNLPLNSAVTETIVQQENCPVTDQSELEDAREYYGKAFLLFLTNLGMQLSNSQKRELELVVDNPKEYVENRDEQLETASAPEVDVDKKENQPEALATIEVDEGYPPNWRRNIVKANTFVIQDPLTYFGQSRVATPKDRVTRRLNGSYTGQLFIQAGKQKGEMHQVELTIDYSIEEGRGLQGNYSLIISKDNHPYSRMNGSGGNHDIRLNPNDPRAIILNASPDSFFHFANQELKLANFYDKGKKIGVAILQTH